MYVLRVLNFDTLQRRFVLNTFINTIFIDLAPTIQFLLLMNATEPIWTDSSRKLSKTITTLLVPVLAMKRIDEKKVNRCVHDVMTVTIKSG